MAQDNPFPMLGGLTFSEDVFYRLLDDLLGTGVVGATDYQVIQNHLGANMSVDVQPGSAYVLFTSVAGGKRRTRLPAQSNSGTPGSPNSADKWLTTFVAADVTNPRIDRVVLTVRDTALDGSGASDSALRVIAGTPTAGATTANLNGAAAVPANSILLANVLVPANATTVITANIADVRALAKVAAGNVLPAAVAPQFVTTTQFNALTPTDGMEVYLIVDATNGVNWHLRYNAAQTTYKWEYLGGAPLYAEVVTAEGSPGAYGDATTVISITAPRAGVYDLGHDVGLFIDSAGAGQYIMYATLKLGAIAAGDNESGGPEYANQNAAHQANIARHDLRRTLAAADVVKQQYRGNGANSVGNRVVTMRPVRIS